MKNKDKCRARTVKEEVLQEAFLDALNEMLANSNDYLNRLTANLEVAIKHNSTDEKLAEKMKEAGKTDILIMGAGPYKHNSCMSAYCVDAQKMADAAGMLCWIDDGMVRYFSQILFHE